MTIAAPPTRSKRSVRTSDDGQHFVLYGETWESYQRWLRDLDNRHLFLTYDRGRLELMSPSYEHDKSSQMLAQLIRTIAEELNLPLSGAGSTTFRRKDLDRGLEPDNCFYIKNEMRIRGKKKLDLRRDPPPDLAIEVEISYRIRGREQIYAALGVPELWRYDGKRLRVGVLKQDGAYHSVDRSPTFPSLPLRQVELFVKRSFNMDETSWQRQLRRWVRQHLVERKAR